MEAGPYDPANPAGLAEGLEWWVAAMEAGPYDPANCTMACSPGPSSTSRNGGGALRPRKLHDGMFTRAILNEPQWRRGLTTPQTRVTTG